MSIVDFEPKDFHSLSLESRSIEIENEPQSKGTLILETNSLKTSLKETLPTAEDEIVALILSSIMGSIVESWEYLEEDEMGDTVCKSFENIDSSQEKNTLLTYEHSIISALSYWMMSNDGKKHSLQLKNNMCTIQESESSVGQKRLGIILKSIFDDLKEKIFGWQFLEEEPHVRVVFKQGNRFEGKLHQCRMHGQGSFTWADGSLYQGDFRMGEMTGEGRLQWPDQSRYEGQLTGGHRHGIGLFVHTASPTFYAGQWRCGLRHGEGSMFYDQLHTDRDFYNGQWRGDRKCGTGLRSYPSGARCRGQWCHGLRHGLATMVWTNHHVYSGNWSEGQIDGYGEYTWDTFFNRQLVAVQENCYYGDWSQGVRNGNATLETTSGVTIHGTWKNGKKHGPAQVICNNGTCVYANNLFYDDCISTDADISSDSNSLTDMSAHAPHLYHVPANSANHQIDLKFYIDRLRDHNVDCKRTRKAFERNVTLNSDASNVDLHHEEVNLRNTICQHLSVLKTIYNMYADVCCEVKGTLPSVLMRLFLWQLLRDCNLHTRGWSLADFDVLIARNKAALVRGVHYPFERLQFWQFVHCLLEVSWQLYGCSASALHRLITSDVLPNVGKHKGDALFKHLDLLSMDAAYWFFRGLGEPLSARQFLKSVFQTNNNVDPKHNSPDYPAHQLIGRNIIGVGGRVTYYPEDEPLLADLRCWASGDLGRLSPIGVGTVFSCLLDVCPSIADNGFIVNMDYKMVYLEFLELLLVCGKLNVIKHISEAEKEEECVNKTPDGEKESLTSIIKSHSKEAIGKDVSPDSKKKTSEEIKPRKGKKAAKKRS